MTFKPVNFTKICNNPNKDTTIFANESDFVSLVK